MPNSSTDDDYLTFLDQRVKFGTCRNAFADYAVVAAITSLSVLRVLRTWQRHDVVHRLAATSRSLIFLLDDIRTRQRRRLHQQTLPLAAVHPVEAKVEANGETVVGFGSGEAQTFWYYSPQRFPRPGDVEAAIAALLAAARDGRSA